MMSIIKNNLIYPSAFLAGYALHYCNGKIIELAREKLHINADLYGGLPEETYRQKYRDQFIKETPHIKTQALFQCLCMLTLSILEEVGCRYYLQKQILPPLLHRVIPRFANQSAVVISTLSFSFFHFLNSGVSNRATKNALLIHLSLFGLVASLASKKFSLQTAIVMHMGYNLRAWKLTYFDLLSR